MASDSFGIHLVQHIHGIQELVLLHIVQNTQDMILQ